MDVKRIEACSVCGQLGYGDVLYHEDVGEIEGLWSPAICENCRMVRRERRALGFLFRYEPYGGRVEAKWLLDEERGSLARIGVEGAIDRVNLMTRSDIVGVLAGVKALPFPLRKLGRSDWEAVVERLGCVDNVGEIGRGAGIGALRLDFLIDYADRWGGPLGEWFDLLSRLRGWRDDD